jgi:hypothetical protein
MANRGTKTTQRASVGVHALLQCLRVATRHEAAQLLPQFQAAVHEGVLQAQDFSSKDRQAVQQPRSIIKAVLAIVTALEASGMRATSLGRGLSNRSDRASQIDQSTLVPLQSLDTAGVPQEKDLILDETGPVAL